MTYEVLMTAGSKRDLEAIHDYISESDSQTKAGHVMDSLRETIGKLAVYPERGSIPKELAALGIRNFRQSFFKPYRIIYRIIGKRVYIDLIADGRRDMQSLLSRRLLGG